MKISNIILLSLGRQPGKKLLLLMSLSLSLAAILTLVSFVQSQERSIEQQFDEYGANIIIVPRTDQLSLSYGGLSLSSVVTQTEELHRDDRASIYNIPNSSNIRAVSPKLIGHVQARSTMEPKDVLLVGVELEEERKIKTWWDITGHFPEAENQFLLGWNAAEVLGVTAGDSISIEDRSYAVSGVLKPTGGPDDHVIIASIVLVETLLNRPGAVSMIDVSALCSDCPIDELVAQISAALPHGDVKALRQVMNQRMEMVHRFGQFALILALLITFLAAFLTMTIVSASIGERKKEIGIFRALGFSRGNIIGLIQGEIVIISLASAALGLFLSWILSYSLLPIITELDVDQLVFKGLTALIGVVGLPVLALLAALFPSLKASRIDPVDAIQGL